ncbi:MAG: hypothetical protein O7B35_17725 [Deltaproteobacteria bacterium]|nr:hypothetical protein [Deltaproteobacteria bacterium]
MMKIKTLRDTYRTISQFHENDRLAASVQSWRFFAWFTPKRRRLFLSLGAIAAGLIGLLNRYVKWSEHFTAPSWLAPSFAMPILLGFLYLVYLSTKNFSRLPVVVKRRPQISLHILFWATLAVIWVTPNNGELWRTVLILIILSLPYLIWRCGYMIKSGQRGKSPGAAFHDHLFYLWPIWDGTNTPAGKGSDYLSQCEAQSAEAYARSSLAGIKLLILAMLWGLTLLFMGGLVYGDPKNPLTDLLGGYSLEIPRLKNIARGNIIVSLPIAWISLYCELIWQTLKIAARGHQWIGMLRLFGFNVFRNTYKPLLAESIVDFWNRFYYYFKELLVEFFFFPTYLKYFRTQPKLRMFTAIFMAAFVGNLYYHVLQMKGPLVLGEFAKIWQSLGSRMVYAIFLTVGIYVSMLRQQRQRGKRADSHTVAARVGRLRRIAGVWTFYSLINFWNLRSRLTLLERTKVFLSFFGL